MVLLKTVKLVVTGVSKVASDHFVGHGLIKEFVRHFYFSEHLLEGMLEIVKSER